MPAPASPTLHYTARTPPAPVLLRAYHATAYTVPAWGLDLRVGCYNPRLLAVMGQHATGDWALLTAANPGSRPTPPAANRARQGAMLRCLRRMGWYAYPAWGHPLAPGWAPEPAFFVPGLPARQARALCRAFGQVAWLGPA